ncbi:SRPBCC domain-containing protein [Thermoactinospora rubra]|uniref:SRPBCC domain-containing protein n=1 Tax=Thermoactinospora rubra TaxID=1088767 RepID=UPI001301E418|nr:SRPBCC domain-containing protein [Thermoactinospora rubra]
MDRIEREIAIAAPVERVWDLIASPASLARWFPGAAMELREGAPARFDLGAEDIINGVVERVDPPRLLSWRWCLAPGHSVQDDRTTLVTLTLTGEGGRTRVRVVETGFDVPPWSAENWDHALAMLTALAREMQEAGER